MFASENSFNALIFISLIVLFQTLFHVSLHFTECSRFSNWVKLQYTHAPWFVQQVRVCKEKDHWKLTGKRMSFIFISFHVLPTNFQTYHLFVWRLRHFSKRIASIMRYSESCYIHDMSSQFVSGHRHMADSSSISTRTTSIHWTERSTNIRFAGYCLETPKPLRPWW